MVGYCDYTIFMRLLHFHSALFCGTHKSLNKARVSCVYYHFLSTSPGDGWRGSARGWCRDTDSGGMAAIQLSFCLCSRNLSPSFVIVARKLSSSLSLKFGQGGQGCCAGACERGRVVAVRQFMHCFHQHNSVWLWISSK